MNDNTENAKQEILQIISKSSLPEDLPHAKNTVEWVLKLNPKASQAMQIAALAHDIDRADEKQKIKRSNFDHYDTFKTVHAQRSSSVLKKILKKHDLAASLIHDACELVKHHEFGGDPQSDLLREADSLSYFETNLPHYFKREGWTETKRRCVWGLQRLSDENRKKVLDINYPDKQLALLIQDSFSEAISS